MENGSYRENKSRRATSGRAKGGREASGGDTSPRKKQKQLRIIYQSLQKEQNLYPWHILLMLRYKLIQMLLLNQINHHKYYPILMSHEKYTRMLQK